MRCFTELINVVILTNVRNLNSVHGFFFFWREYRKLLTNKNNTRFDRLFVCDGMTVNSRNRRYVNISLLCKYLHVRTDYG
jgi:hypothetical protein